MVHSTKSRRQNTRFTGVFQFHDNRDKDVDEARTYVIDVITKCLASRQPLPKRDFNLTLYYGSYGGKRWTKDLPSSLKALVWKYSELTGKYCGCQYWSVRAKKLFDDEKDKLTPRADVSLEDAWELTNHLAAKNSNPPEKRLVHEHVFPIKHLLQDLQGVDDQPTSEGVRKHVELKAVGCVITEGEHCRLNRVVGDTANPWLRYKGNIQLINNPEWPSLHRQLIMNAKLL